MKIGLAGKKGVGKTTIADALEDKFGEFSSFSRPIKSMIDDMLFYLGYEASEIRHFNRNKDEIIPKVGRSMRYLWQTLGTDWGRNMINPDLWVNCASKDCNYDDVRFENEADFIRKNGGVIVHVILPGSSNDPHESELGIAVKAEDIVVINDGTIEDAAEKIKNAIEERALWKQ